MYTYIKNRGRPQPLKKKKKRNRKKRHNIKYMNLNGIKVKMQGKINDIKIKDINVNDMK